MIVADAARDFLACVRVVHLATADRSGIPHIVPVCFALAGDTLYSTIDEKPKQGGLSRLKRLRNIAENPHVAVLADRYDEDWARLAWVRLDGRAELLPDGVEHDQAQTLLRARYKQYARMALGPLPVIACRIERVASWGDLSAVP